MLRITSSLPRCWPLGSNKIQNHITKIPLYEAEFLFYQVKQNAFDEKKEKLKILIGVIIFKKDDILFAMIIFKCYFCQNF